MQKLGGKGAEQIRRGKLRKLGVRFEIKPWKETTILWERSVPAEQGHGTPDPWTEKGLIQRTGEIVSMRMMDYGIFAPTEKSDVAYAYVVGTDDIGVWHVALFRRGEDAVVHHPHRPNLPGALAEAFSLPPIGRAISLTGGG